jgi:hypothetical protein
MTEYAILIPADETAWASASAEEHAAMYEKHMKFAELLAARGHKVTAGNELTPSAGARVVRGALDKVSVTDGPYAETAEQLSGFYVVDTDDLEDLCKVVGILAEGSRGIEVRACVDHSG